MFKVTKWCGSITGDHKDRIIEVTQHQKVSMPFEFRLLDDDHIVYAYGISSDNDSETAFEPLDTLQNHYGCTEIQYRNKYGKWESL